MTTDELYPAGRLDQVREAAGAAGLDAVLLTPGPDLRYAIGYDAKQLERLTCLAVPAHGNPALFVPRLELAAAQASPAGSSGLEMIPWEETDDPFRLVASMLGNAATIGLSDRMWALSVLKFRDALPLPVFHASELQRQRPKPRRAAFQTQVASFNFSSARFRSVMSNNVPRMQGTPSMSTGRALSNTSTILPVL